MVEAEENEKTNMSRKEKKKLAKKNKRKEKRRELAEKEKEEEEVDEAEEERKLEAIIREAEEEREKALKEFEERERLWLEVMELKKKKELEEQEEEERRRALEEEEEEAKRQLQVQKESDPSEDDEWEYVEEGPAEIIWQGNEIIIKKKKVRVPKKESNQRSGKEDADRPYSNPLPPQSEAFSDYKSAHEALESVAQHVPNFGTEQDKAHCPFHLKTGACRFGQSCSRVHFYPDKSCTLLIKNMYNGPGLAWEQDEGLEHTDEEIEHAYEEFYEDVHTEFLKFGEIVNFKVCRNGSFHLRGNVYVQFKTLESAIAAYQSINGRYFAGKQVNCEFINVTRWKVAICGEYMKSRFKTCSHGTACNFIHCFRNPGGDYEWADWDKPPPVFWVKKMAGLFGYADEYGHDKYVDHGNAAPRKNYKYTADSDRRRSRRSRSKEMDRSKGSSCRNHTDEDNLWESMHNHRSNSDNRKRIKLDDEKLHRESKKIKDRHHSENRIHEICSEGSCLDTDRDKDRDRGGGRHRKSSWCHSRSFEKSSDNVNTKGTHESDFYGNGLNKDRERESSGLEKHSRDRNKVRYLDNHTESRKRKDVESSGDHSKWDSNRDRERHRRRKHSRYETEVSESSDYEHRSTDKVKENHYTESDSDRSDRRRGRGKTHRSPSKRSHSTKENTKPDKTHLKSIEDHEPSSSHQTDERFLNISSDRWRPSSLEEHSDRQITCAQSSDSSRPGRYINRSKSPNPVSKYCYDDENDDHLLESKKDAYKDHTTE